MRGHERQAHLIGQIHSPGSLAASCGVPWRVIST